MFVFWFIKLCTIAFGTSLTTPLLLLSRFSRVRLCVTPKTAAHQAPPSLGFSGQEHWSRLPFPSPMRESEVAQSRPTLSDPMDCSLPGFAIHGIFQARELEWGAIAISWINEKNLEMFLLEQTVLQFGAMATGLKPP